MTQPETPPSESRKHVFYGVLAGLGIVGLMALLVVCIILGLLAVWFILK